MCQKAAVNRHRSKGFASHGAFPEPGVELSCSAILITIGLSFGYTCEGIFTACDRQLLGFRAEVPSRNLFAVCLPL